MYCLNNDALKIVFRKVPPCILLPLRGVCRRWYRIISEDLELDIKVLPRGAWHAIEFARGCGKAITRLELPENSALSDHEMASVLAWCPKLSELTFRIESLGSETVDQLYQRPKLLLFPKGKLLDVADQAVYRDDKTTVEVLCRQAGVNPFRPMHLAMDLGRGSIIRALLMGEYVPFWKCWMKAASRENPTAMDVMVDMSMNGLFEVNPNRRNTAYRTAAYEAARLNYWETLEVLLRHPGVDPNEGQNNEVFHLTPLLIACRNGYMAVVKVLLQREDLNLSEGWLQVQNNQNVSCVTPIFSAIAQHHLSIARLLMNDGRNCGLNMYRIDAGITLMHYAVLKKQNTLLRWLLADERVNVNVPSRGNAAVSPFHLACSSNNHEAVNMLLQSGRCNVWQSAQHGLTGLFFALNATNPHIAELIINHLENYP